MRCWQQSDLIIWHLSLQQAMHALRSQACRVISFLCMFETAQTQWVLSTSRDQHICQARSRWTAMTRHDSLSGSTATLTWPPARSRVRAGLCSATVQGHKHRTLTAVCVTGSNNSTTVGPSVVGLSKIAIGSSAQQPFRNQQLVNVYSLWSSEVMAA